MRFRMWLTALVLAFTATPAVSGNLYGVCAACHGAEGEGNTALNAPRIAGLPAWYTERQLNNFKSGVRGSDAKDVYGTQMRPMAMTLPDESSIKAVASQVELMKGPVPEPTIEGDIAKGKASYQVCVACHGADGKGNEALNAPPLAGQYDWYIARQIAAYKSGLRGTHKDDMFGQQMRPMALILADDETINAVAAYIQTLDD